MRYRNLQRASDREALLGRLASLAPDASARWGRMDCTQMVAHLCDACRMALAERAVSPVRAPLPPAVMKFWGLRVPLRWPKSVPAPREIRQGRGGTPPNEFSRDLAELTLLMRELASRLPELDGRSHPIFGPLDPWEWGRWAWLHTDHHLRQFGA